MLAIALMSPLGAQQAPAAGVCRITGRVTSGTTALPGVAIAVKTGDTIKGATSTETDGGFGMTLTPGAYTLTAELTGFTHAQQALTIPAEGTCSQVVNLALTLAPRNTPTPAPRPAQPGSAPVAGAPAGGRGTAPSPNAAGGRGRGQTGFQTLDVQQQGDAATAAQATTPETDAAAVQLLLPPGFSPDTSGDAITITGNNASLDRGMMQDRFDAIGRGVFDPSSGEFGAGFGPPGGGDGQGRGGPGGFGGRGGPGGPGGPGGRGGPGGPGGPGGGRGGDGAGFFLGGRGGQQNRYNGTANYTFGGSALDSAPYQLRPDSIAGKNPYTKNTYGATIGGPVKIHGLYNGTNKTNFVLTFNGNRGSSLFDQLATVPTAALRAGDFSTVAVPLVDPATQQPFLNNQIPASRISPSAQALLRFMPLPNLDGDTQNFHNTNTVASSSDTINLRVTHNFTPAAAGGRGGGRGGAGGGRAGGGAARGPGGRGGRGAQQGTSVNMTAQLQYRHADNDILNVLPQLGGHSSNTSVAVPISFNIRHKRTMHAVNVNFSSTSANTANHFAGVENVSAAAGITGVSTDPFDYGVSSLSFSGFQSVRDVTPSRRTDRRLTAGYSWTLPIKTHQLRAGGDIMIDRTSSQTAANANGAFVFTGLYSAGNIAGRVAGADFADFLLGVAQQGTLQFGPGNVQLRGRSASLFLQDDWRKSAKLTLSLGLRYERISPFTEANGHLVNLDVPSDFTAAVPVQSGGTGPFTGPFPAALLDTDTNNVAPRLGAAYRLKPGLIIRGGYGVSYNSGSYSTIARQLASQPPFAESDTVLGSALVPLQITNAFGGSTANQTTNNFGVAKDYALGRVQTWNADVSKDLRQAWNVGAGYTRTTGASLDIVRAPNRGPLGLRIPDVQAFNWQTAEGISVLNAGTFRLQRRMVKGIGGSVTYTLAKSMDNASNIGGGATVVAQNDQDLAAEYSLSSFDRRHQIASDLSFELPFGPNKHWLHSGGRAAALLGGWRGSANFTWQSGTPFTPRVTNAATDVSRGTNGTLRANYNGDAISLASPTIAEFFNTAAFSIPIAGTFGNAPRNLIIGPGSRLLNAQISRDVRMHGNRAVTIQATASNILNMVNYAAIDTLVNSPTFGQVLSVRPMRSAQLIFRFRF
jgi:hypothetical protein